MILDNEYPYTVVGLGQSIPTYDWREACTKIGIREYELPTTPITFTIGFFDEIIIEILKGDY